MMRYWNPFGWLWPMLAINHTPTRFARKDLPGWVQGRRIAAARAKRARRQERNLRLVQS